MVTSSWGPQLRHPCLPLFPLEELEPRFWHSPQHRESAGRARFGRDEPRESGFRLAPSPPAPTPKQNKGRHLLVPLLVGCALKLCLVQKTSTFDKDCNMASRSIFSCQRNHWNIIYQHEPERNYKPLETGTITGQICLCFLRSTQRGTFSHIWFHVTIMWITNYRLIN